MLKIFNGCDTNTLESWVGKFDSQSSRNKLTDEQLVSFLELAERRVVAEDRNETVRTVRERLAPLYSKSGQYEQAAEYLGKLRESARTPEQKDAVLGQLLEVYLHWPRVDSAAWLISNCLLERDLSPNSAVVRSLDSFLDNPAGGADPNAVLKALRKIKLSEQRPMWEQRLARWTGRFGLSKDVDDPNGGG
jgi:hypothetical protein